MVALFQNMKIFRGIPGNVGNTSYVFGAKMTPMHFLVLLLILIVLTCLLTRKMTKSWFGLALASLRNDEGATMSFGINVKSV